MGRYRRTLQRYSSSDNLLFGLRSQSFPSTASSKPSFKSSHPSSQPHPSLTQRRKTSLRHWQPMPEASSQMEQSLEPTPRHLRQTSSTLARIRYVSPA